MQNVDLIYNGVALCLFRHRYNADKKNSLFTFSERFPSGAQADPKVVSTCMSTDTGMTKIVSYCILEMSLYFGYCMC